LQSLTAAAERLGLTQPAISHALRRLRELLNDPLFVRTPSGMVPTDAARELDGPLTQAFAIISQALQQRARFDASTAERTFRVSMSDMSELYFLPPLLARIAKAAPQVRLEVSTVSSESLCSAMRSGTVDLALGFIPNLGSGCISETLFWDEHVFFLRACRCRRHARECGATKSWIQHPSKPVEHSLVSEGEP
jgi:DNA-binding transcriptional LysR family regulator